LHLQPFYFDLGFRRGDFLVTEKVADRAVALPFHTQSDKGSGGSHRRHDEGCVGEAKCGACHIFVHDGRKTVSKMQRLENERLDAIVGVGSKSRLACLTRLGGENVTIELLGFGSGL
jgi:ferredoxin